MTIAEETAAMRAQSGVRSITHEQWTALANTTKTAPRAASDIYSNPPDGYAIALAKQRMSPSIPSPRAATDIPDGYRIALDNLARQTSTPAPPPSVAPDGYQIALDKQRKEKK